MFFLFDSGRSLTYDPKDALYNKTSSAPLPTGGKESGMLVFDLAGESQPDAEITGTVYRLICTDIFGNSIHEDHSIQGNHIKNPEQFPYLPGTTEPTIK